MPVVHTGETEADKELAKWNRPYRFEPFPQMLYKAIKKPNGKVVCMEPAPMRLGFLTDAEYLLAVEQANALIAQCHIVVRNEDERRGAVGRGWREDPSAAVAQFEREEQAIGNAAAEAAFAAQRMSAKARAELQAAEDATHEHVADVPAPRKKRGRPPRRSRAVPAPAQLAGSPE